MSACEQRRCLECHRPMTLDELGPERDIIRCMPCSRAIAKRITNMVFGEPQKNMPPGTPSRAAR